MSTIGDSLCDVANLSMMYYMPRNADTGISGIAGLDLHKLSIPKRIDLLKMYCHERIKSTNNDNGIDDAGRAMSISKALEWNGFYLAFLFFKNCVIVQGVAQRSMSGVASSAVANKVAKLFPVLVSMTQDMIDKQVRPTLSSRL